jgi:hypothetical protein
MVAVSLGATFLIVFNSPEREYDTSISPGRLDFG